MRRERVVQAGACHRLVARMAKGESKGLRRYDKESILWQSSLTLSYAKGICAMGSEKF